jgi:hypothetical protein
MTTMKPCLTSFAPQFLVDDLDRSIAYYRKIGFNFGFAGWFLTQLVIRMALNST